MADVEVTINDNVGPRDGFQFTGPIEEGVGLSDPLALSDSITQAAVYAITISDRLSLIDTQTVTRGHAYPRRGRQHGAAPATSIPYRSRIVGGR